MVVNERQVLVFNLLLSQPPVWRSFTVFGVVKAPFNPPADIN